MVKLRIGKPHVVRSSSAGNNILESQDCLRNYVKLNVFKFLKGKKCNFIDDLIGDTFLEIFEYSKKYDQKRNIAAKTFINLRLNGSIVDNYLKYLQSVKTPRYVSKYDNETGLKDQRDFYSNIFDNSINPMDLHGDKDHVENNVDRDFQPRSQEIKIQKNEICDLHKKMLNFVNTEFSQIEKEIFKMRFINEMTQKEVAKKIGKTHQAVSEREKKIITKLKKKFSQKFQDLDI
jgi:RNA polymerase sigma factor (sigma-70 family)